MIQLLAALVFLSSFQVLANKLCEGNFDGSEPTLRGLPVAPRDAKLDRRDFAGVLAEAIQTQPPYGPLGWTEHEPKRRFLTETFLPYTGWRGILARPGDFRPVTVQGNRLVLHAYGGSSAITFVWETGLQEPRWSVAGDTGFHAFTLRIPVGYTFAPSPDADPFFDTGLIGHDLQRYTATLEIQRIRQVLGEDRFVIKPGQKTILEKFSKALDSENGITRFLVLGPSAYGKTFLLINAMKERMRRRLLKDDSSRNLFVVVTRKRNIAAQITDEIFYDHVLSQSKPSSFEHWGLHTEEEKAQKWGPQDIIRKSQQARDHQKSLIVTIDWSTLTTIVKNAEHDPKVLEALRLVLNGLYIDEADQTHLPSHLQTIQTLTADQSGIVIWGQDAMSFHREVRDVVFRGHVYRIFEDELDPTVTDAATITVQQTRIATHRGEIAPIVDFRHHHVITHYTPAEILESLISSGIEVPYNALFQPIEDPSLRRAIYKELAQKIVPFLQRHRGYIRVNTIEQADHLEAFLNEYREENRLHFKIAAFHSKTRQSDTIYSRWRNYHTSEDPIDWLISVRLLDESVNAEHISGVLLLTDDIDEETFLKIYGRPTRHFPGKRYSEIWQISHDPIVDQKIIDGLRQKEQDLNTPAEDKTENGTRLGGGARLETMDVATQHLLPLFPTDVRDLEHLHTKITELNQALTVLAYLLSDDVASALLQPFASSSPAQQKQAILGLSSRRKILLAWASRILSQHLGPHLFTNHEDRKYIGLAASIDPRFERFIPIFRDVNDAPTIDAYLKDLKALHLKVKNDLYQSTSFDVAPLLKPTPQGAPDLLNAPIDESQLVNVILPSYESNTEVNSSVLKVMSQSLEFRQRLKALWPITKTEAFSRMRRLKTSGLWTEAISFEQCEEQMMKALLQVTISFEEIEVRIYRLTLAKKYGKPDPLRVDQEYRLIRTRQKQLLETAAILIPSDPILQDMVRSFQDECPPSTDLSSLGRFQCTAAMQGVAHLEAIYENLFPHAIPNTGAAVVLRVFANSRFSPLDAIQSLIDTRDEIIRTEKMWMAQPQTSSMREFADAIFKHGNINSAIYIGMVFPERNDPLIFKKLIRLHNDRIKLLQDALALEGDITLSRDDFSILSRQHIETIFLGHEDLKQSPDMAKIMMKNGLQAINVVQLSGSLTYDPRMVTENHHDVRNLLHGLSQSYPQWMDPSTPPLDNLWNLRFDGLDHKQKQLLIQSQFEAQYRAWLNQPHRMHLGHILSDDTKIPNRAEEILYWLYQLSWQATQFVLIQKSLDPEYRFMPIEDFSNYQQAVVGKAVQSVNQYLRTEAKNELTGFNLGVDQHPAHPKIKEMFWIEKPLEQLYESSLLTLRHEIKRNLADLKDLQKAYGSLHSVSIWEAYQSSSQLALGLDRWVTPTNVTRPREYYAKHVEKLVRALYQVEIQLYQVNPKVHAKPKKP